MAEPNDQELQASQDWFNQVDQVRSNIRSSPYAGSIDGTLRQYPALSKDMTAAFIVAGLDPENPELAAAIRNDARQSSLLSTVVNNTIGRVTRPITAAFYDTWDTSVTKWFRVGTDMIQQLDRHGEFNPLDSYLSAGLSITGQAAKNLRQGNTTPQQLLTGNALGTGIIAGRREGFIHQPGAGETFQNALIEGATVEEALTEAESYVADRYGADIVNQAYESAELTQLHVTFDGVDYGYGVSAGRLATTPLAMMEIIQPKSLASNLISGTLDGTTQVFLDPWDPIFNQASRLFKARRAIRPTPISTVEQAIEMQGGVPLTDFRMKGPHHGAVGTGSRVEGIGAEGYVFHGGVRVPEGEDLTTAGLSFDLRRSQGYAASKGESDPVVYVLKVDELPENVQQRLMEGGEIEQYYNVGEILPPEELDGWVEAINNVRGQQDAAYAASKAFDDALVENNPQWAQYLDDYVVGLVDEGDVPRMTIGEAEEAFLTVDELVERNKLYDDIGELQSDMADMHYEMGTMSSAEQASIMHHTQGLDAPNNMNVPGSYALPSHRVLEMADVEEMLEKRYLFPDGRGSMEDAYKFLDEELQVARSHGKWEPKFADEYVQSRRGQQNIDQLIDESIPKYVKMEKLHAAGVPWEDLQRLFVKLKRAKGDAAKRAIAAEHMEAWINGQRLTEQVQVVGGARAQLSMMASNSKITGSTKMEAPKRRIGDWGRRWGAASTVNRLDPWDFDTNYDTIVNSMDTLGASPEVVDDILDAAWDAMGSPDKMKNVLGKFLDEYRKSVFRSMGGLEMSPADAQDLVDDIALAFNKYYDLENSKALYNIDQVGNPLMEPDSYFETRNTSSGLSYRVLSDSAVLDSEMSITHIHVPGIRELRQATSKGRQLRNSTKRFKDGIRNKPPRALVLFEPSVVQEAANIGFAGWRNVQLLRMGWMTSVLPDEIARAFAEGHSETIGNPIFLWGLMTNNTGAMLPSGKILDEVAQASGGYGVGSFLVGAKDQPLDEAFGATSSAWVDVDVYDHAGNISFAGATQLARNYNNLYQSKLVRQLWEYDLDVTRTVDYLVNHPDSPLIEIITGKGSGAVPGERTRLGQVREHWNDGKNPDIDEMINTLTRNMEIVKHRMILLGGGDYVKRSVDDPTKWVNSAGGAVETYAPNTASNITGVDGQPLFWNMRTMREELLRRELKETGGVPANLHSKDGQRVTADDLRVRLMQQDGIRVDLARIPESQQHVVTKDANPELLNVMGSGKKIRGEVDQAATATARRQALIGEARDLGIPEGNQLYMIEEMLDGNVISVRFHHGAERASVEFGRGNAGNMRFTVVDTSSMDGEQFMEIQRIISNNQKMSGDDLADLDELFEVAPMRTVELDRGTVATRADSALADGEQQLLFDEMDITDLDEFTEVMRTGSFTDEYPAPEKVRGPSDAVAGKPAIINEFITEAFRWIGQKPSEVLARNPYTRVRAWETAADYYLYASPAIRKEIKAAALAADITSKDFDRLLRRSQRLAGLEELPSLPSANQLTMPEIEQLMVARALKDTRELFFDLSKRGNWADALKVIFPFGDAWWEVLTRWGKLMNPMKTQEFGKPFRNLRRAQQLTMAGQRSGWFDTNLQGERVFTTYPGPALISKLFGILPEGIAESDQVRVGTLGFINFADTRSVLGPGTSPLVQFGGALFRPLFEDNPRLMNIINTAIYGGFQPSTLSDGWDSYVLPSYMKNAQSWLMAGEYDLEFASLQIDIANAMVASDPRKWENVGNDMALMEELMITAREDASTMGFIKIFSSWMLPSQPQLAIEAIKMGEAGEVFLTPAAMANDLAFLSDFMDQDEALETVHSWYGADPLAVARKSYSINSRPLTQSGYEMIQSNPGSEEILPYTLAAFMPETEGEEFYSQEYQRQLDSGDREKLTLRQSYQLLSYKQGQLRMIEVKEQRDKTLRDAEAIWGKDSQEYRDFNNYRVKQWYNDAKRGIELMYYGYGKGGGGPAGITKRPTYEQIKDEMIQIGTLGTRENEMGRSLDPALTAGIVEITGWWATNDQISVSLGHEAAWWYSGTAQTDWTTAGMRSEFSTRLRRLIARQENEEVKHKLKWYADYVVTPLMSGYDLENPFIVTVDPILIGEV